MQGALQPGRASKHQGAPHEPRRGAALLKVLRRHAGRLGLNENACYALCNLAEHPDNQVPLMNLGAGQALLYVLRRHAGRLSLNENACYALCNLATHQTTRCLS